MVCRRDAEKKRIKDRDVRDAEMQMVNFKQLRRSERIKDQTRNVNIGRLKRSRKMEGKNDE